MDTRKDILDEALAVWRESNSDEALSPSARTALFDEVRALSGATQAPFVPSLTRAWRWAFLGSVPTVALLAALMIVGGDRSTASAAPLAAAKVSGQVVFTLANGKSDHLVYRSTHPQSFDRTAAVKMARNRYSEKATGGPNLVFYRID
jgi:hypothetical protein